MKKHYVLAALLLRMALLQAQIPNPDFANWNNGLPVGWYGINNPDTLFVESYYGYFDSTALRMNVTITGDSAYGGNLFTGNAYNHNFPISTLPTALHGWYIGNPATAGDGLVINSNLFSGKSLVANIEVTITEATDVYKQFAFNYNYVDTGGGAGNDSAFIEFGIQTQSGNQLSQSTYFIIDNLSFSYSSTGIANTPGGAVLEQCIPNPATNKVDIIYSLTANSLVNLSVYDMTGRQVKLLLSDTWQTPGRYKILTDINDLPAGLYFCRINANGGFYENKLVVAR